MTCPVCGCSNYDDVKFCSFCGAQLVQEEPKTSTPPTTNFNIAPTQSMIFHYIFCILTLWGGASIFGTITTAISILGSFNQEKASVVGIALAIIVPSIVLQLLDILKAIFLLQRKAVGYKMQRIVSWIKVFGGMIGVAIAVFTAILGNGPGQYDGLWYIVSLVMGFGSIPLIAWEGAALVYYKKRKDLFFK